MKKQEVKMYSNFSRAGDKRLALKDMVNKGLDLIMQYKTNEYNDMTRRMHETAMPLHDRAAVSEIAAMQELDSISAEKPAVRLYRQDGSTIDTYVVSSRNGSFQAAPKLPETDKINWLFHRPEQMARPVATYNLNKSDFVGYARLQG
jgi:hypothetical protein